MFNGQHHGDVGIKIIVLNHRVPARKMNKLSIKFRLVRGCETEHGIDEPTQIVSVDPSPWPHQYEMSEKHDYLKPFSGEIVSRERSRIEM